MYEERVEELCRNGCRGLKEWVQRFEGMGGKPGAASENESLFLLNRIYLQRRSIESAASFVALSQARCCSVCLKLLPAKGQTQADMLRWIRKSRLV